MHSNRQSNWSDLSLPEESQTLPQLPPYNDQSHQQATYGYSHDPNQLLHPDTNSLYPIPPRLRSKSDVSLQNPQWNPSMSRDDSPALDDASTTVNVGDLQQSSSQSLQLPRHPASADSLHTNFNIGSSPAVYTHSQYVFGGAGPSNSNFLSPDSNLRRSKSDAGSRLGHRVSRSEDIRSVNNNLLCPPTSQLDFMKRNQFLSPQETVPPIRGAHHRRASSGSRLNGGADRADGSGLWSSSSSTRPSPYPSPNASPRVTYDELPILPPPTSRYLPQPDVDSRLGLGLDMQASQESRGRSSAKAASLSDAVGNIVVSKPNVTTGRTANASHKRRKQEATFTCPVPKCGSTFTRSFNLRGMCVLPLTTSRPGD